MMASMTITASEALAAWDAGDLVWSVSMGGMGPGYEQAIQCMGFEFLRWMLANPPEDGWEKMGDDPDAWRHYTDDCDKASAVVVKHIGPSGAQHGAAMNIAAVFARRGYSAGLAMADSDRHILVSRNFPSCP